ncbi:MAG: Pectate lyase superfamily protein [Bryobacterales bacterium]|nr:Pectate lyase superfamily protein [Bryobacterales bacterium]
MKAIICIFCICSALPGQTGDSPAHALTTHSRVPGTVARNVQDALDDVRSVRSFGGDGMGHGQISDLKVGSDDTAALNVALAWLCSSPNSRTLFIPEGVYKYTGALTCAMGGESFPVNGIRLYGAGAGSVLLNAGTNNGGLLITAPSGVTQETGLAIDDLHFVNANSGTSPYELKLENQNGFHISNILIDGHDAVTDAIQIQATQMGVLHGIFIRNTKYGYHLISENMRVSGRVGTEAISIDGGYVHGCTGMTTTVAANIATGPQVVTPASMAGIIPGSVLTVYNPGGASGNMEPVVVTAATRTTFTATFKSPKTGPGIIVSVPGGAAALLESAGTLRMSHIHISGTCEVGVDIAPALVTPADEVVSIELDNMFFETTAQGGVRDRRKVMSPGNISQGGKVSITNSSFYEPTPFMALNINGTGYNIDNNFITGTAYFGPDIVDVKFTNNHIYGEPSGPGTVLPAFFSSRNFNMLSSGSKGQALPNFPTYWPNRAVWQSESTADGDIGQFRANPLLNGNHGISVVGAGGGGLRTGTVTTDGSTSVVLISGDGFLPTQVGRQITIGGVRHTIGRVVDRTHLITTTAAAAGRGIAYTAPGFGHSYVRLGGDTADAPVVAGDTGNVVIGFCSHEDCLDPRIMTDASQILTYKNINQHGGFLSMVTLDGQIQLNRDDAGHVPNASGHGFSFIPNRVAGNSLALNEWNGDGTLNSTPLLIHNGNVQMPSASLGAPLGIASGGTGATTPAAARANLSAVTRATIAQLTTVLSSAPATYSQSYETNLANAINGLTTALNSALKALGQ